LWGHSAVNFGAITVFIGRVPFIYIVMRAIRATMLGAFCELFGELISVSNRYQIVIK